MRLLERGLPAKASSQADKRINVSIGIPIRGQASRQRDAFHLPFLIHPQQTLSAISPPLS